MKSIKQQTIEYLDDRECNFCGKTATQHIKEGAYYEGCAPFIFAILSGLSKLVGGPTINRRLHNKVKTTPAFAFSQQMREIEAAQDRKIDRAIAEGRLELD